MKKNSILNKKGFSFIEIIIVSSIIIILGIIGYASKVGYDENSLNSKILSDTKTINNALLEYSQENSKLPIPGGNINFYGSDTSYIHSYENSNIFGVYGSFTENILTKKYLDNVPIDPRTNSYYAYGKTKNTNQFEIASVQIIDSIPTTRLTGNYDGKGGPLSLIREYNGPIFLYNGSDENFPYNPEELVLIAKDVNGNIYRAGDTITVNAGEELELFFSDGSVSVLGDTSSETILTLNELNFVGKDNLNTIVKLGLQVGRIWTKATKLNKNSKFEVNTSDSVAGVRGTIFYVDKNVQDTEVVVIEGEVYVILNDNVSNDNITHELKIENGEAPKKIIIKNGDFIEGSINRDSIKNIEPEFSYNGVNKNIECETFEIPFLGCMDKENSLEGEGWQLYAYAPYDKDGDLNMYSKTNIIVSSSGILNNEIGVIDYCINSNNIDSSFCLTGEGEKGIFIDNDKTDDYIKYSNINLNGDFVIEMNVKILNYNKKKYLFYGNNKGLFIENNNKLIIKTLDNEQIDTSINYNYNEFTKITFIKEGDNIKIKINNTEKYNEIVALNDLFNNGFYIGGTYNEQIGYIGQINGIIDYIKIYSK